MGVHFGLNFRKPKKEYKPSSELDVMVRYYFEGKKMNISGGVKCKLKDWNDDWENTRNREPIKKSDSLHEQKNLQLKSKEKELNDLVFRISTNGQLPTCDLIKSLLRRERVEKQKKTLEDVHFSILFEMFRNNITSPSNLKNTESYKKTIKSSINDIIRYVEEYQYKENTLLLNEDITEEWIEGLIYYLDSRGIQPVTIRKKLKVLSLYSTWLSKTKKMDVKIRIPSGFTFKPDREKIFLKREEVLQIWDFKEFDFENPKHTKYINNEKMEYSHMRYIEDKNNSKKGFTTYTSYEIYKDMLLFLCGVGCRFSDMVEMKVDDFDYEKDSDGKDIRDKGFFKFRQQKTGKFTQVPINQMTFLIRNKYVTNKTKEDYLFPRTKFGNPVSNQKFNKHSKEICKIIGLNRKIRKPNFHLNGKVLEGTDDSKPLYTECVSHIGRRTFIREHIELGTPIKTVMKLTGHVSREVFYSYYDVLKTDMLKNNDKLFSLEIMTDNKKPRKEISENKEVTIKHMTEMFKRGDITQNYYEKTMDKLLGV